MIYIRQYQTTTLIDKLNVLFISCKLKKANREKIGLDLYTIYLGHTNTVVINMKKRNLYKL